MMSKKVCLLTGGNSGIGRAAATQLAERGAEVIVASRSRVRGEEAVAAIKGWSGSDTVSLVIMDLSSKPSIQAGCDAFKACHDKLDVLIHNAADFDISRKEPAYSDEDVETVWATNHVGPVFLTHMVVGELSRGEQGRVITVASKGLLSHPFLRVNLALSPDVAGVSGGYFDENRRRVASSRYSTDPTNIRLVMESTGRYVPGLLANPS